MEAAVCGDARDEGVVRHRWTKQLRGLPDGLRLLTRGVDHGVPLAPPQRIEISTAVAAQSFRFWEELGRGPSSREQRGVVRAAQRLAGEVPAEETGASEDQESEFAGADA